MTSAHKALALKRKKLGPPPRGSYKSPVMTAKGKARAKVWLTAQRVKSAARYKDVRATKKFEAWKNKFLSLRARINKDGSPLRYDTPWRSLNAASVAAKQQKAKRDTKKNSR